MTSKSVGKLFVFEGPDGVGKTTIAKKVTQLLASEKIPFEYFSFPGNVPGTLGDFVYRLHHDRGSLGVASICPSSLQTLHIAAHIDSICSSIVPLLVSGTNVILDRFWWSTYIYGLAAGIKPRFLKTIIDAELLSWGKISPELVFYIRNCFCERPMDINSVRITAAYETFLGEKVRLGKVEEVQNAVIIDSVNSIVRIIKSKIHKQLANVPWQATLPQIQQDRSVLSKDVKPSPLAKILKPTIVYDTYWRFAAKRQEIFFARVNGVKSPWTDDAILLEHKFTNAYRASDRVSQYLIRNVIYSGPQNDVDIFFRTILFKLFNKIETWELLLKHTGEISFASFNLKLYDKILSKAIDSNERIYSAAYIMPTGGRNTAFSRKHRMHLDLLSRMMNDDLPQKIAEADSMGKVFELFLSYQGIGNFLAYQFATDLNYSTVTNFSETQFVVPGPGAIDGIRKCFLDTGGLTDAEIIKVVMEHQEEEFDRLEINFKDLWGRRLMLIDCQNLFCETDKYARVKHPEFRGNTGRSRIKQKFIPNPRSVKYWYPPKWGINDLIS